MKILYTLLLLSFSFNLCAQTTTAKILQIRKQYNAITAAQKTYKHDVTDALDESTEGGKIDSYTDKKGIHKVIIKTLFGETKKEIYEFYYDNNQKLIFAMVRNFSYNTTITQADFDMKKSKIIGSKYYFFNEEIIQVVNLKNKILKINTNDINEVIQISESCINTLADKKLEQYKN